MFISHSLLQTLILFVQLVEINTFISFDIEILTSILGLHLNRYKYIYQVFSPEQSC